MMSKPKWNYVVDVVMFSMMGAMIFIGVLMGFFLTSGPFIDERSKYIWGLHRHQWGDIHMILSFVFVGFFLLHLLLHWGWIKGTTRKLLRSPAALILILLLPALIVLCAWSLSEKNSPAYAEYGRRAGTRIGRTGEPPPAPVAEEVAVEKKHLKMVEINGHMSPLDVEKATGVQAKNIARELGLPKDAPLDQNLGRLRRSYDFQIQQVRDLVTRLSGGEIVAVDGDETASKAEPAHRRQGKQEQRGQRRQEINGRLSLGDIERITGVPASAIIKKLYLPDNTSRNELLGRLRKRHGFTMQQVRDAVYALKEK